MIYLDSSAIVKLARVERETAALSSWLSQRTEGRASSVLCDVEVPRAVRKTDPAALPAAAAVIAKLGQVELDDHVRSLAATVDPSALRSLDAIHLASALSLAPPQGSNSVDMFVTYDRRLASAARAAGLTVVAPGASPPV